MATTKTNRLANTIPVLPYQERWIKDDSQLKIAVWSRQSGKSFAAALRAVLKCIDKRTQYIILSKGERQSRLFMEKVKDFCLVFKEAKMLPEYEVIIPDTEEKVMEVFFPRTRSRIIGLPANPDTARGYSGNIVLDEFAFHGDAARIYAACFPIITRGYSIEVISTPNGTAGKFYEIAKAAGLTGAAQEAGNRWSGYKVDVFDAIKQGLKADIDLLKSGVDDDETWRQEYCCEFISDAQNYIPVELIATCVSEEASTDCTDFADFKNRELYLGIDIGRKRDLTIGWLFEKVGDVLWSRHLLVMKGLSFDEQEKQLCTLIECGGKRGQAGVRRVGVDQSGLGMMLAEHLTQKYGGAVEAVTFTQQIKERLAPMVKQGFEDRTIRIPDNREVRADINSVKRFVTLAGNVRFDAEHTDKGHADRFWALALVVNAASTSNVGLTDMVLGTPRAEDFIPRSENVLQMSF